MNKLIFTAAAAASAVLFAGCDFVKYEHPVTYDERIAIPAVNSMSTQQAIDYVQNIMNNPVADSVHGQKNAKFVCQNATSVDYKRHYRTDFYFVEAKSNKQVISSFYVKDKATAEKVAAAIMRANKALNK